MIPRLVQLLVKAHQDAQRHVAAGTQQPYTVSTDAGGANGQAGERLPGGAFPCVPGISVHRALLGWLILEREASTRPLATHWVLPWQLHVLGLWVRPL